jgi:hypothetical protein
VAKKKAAKKRPGRQIDPTSLRQSGKLVPIRLSHDDAERYAELAAGAGVSLSEAIRRFLGAWSAGRIKLPAE